MLPSVVTFAATIESMQVAPGDSVQLALLATPGSVVVVRSKWRLLNAPPENVPMNVGLELSSLKNVKVTVPLRTVVAPSLNVKGEVTPVMAYPPPVFVAVSNGFGTGGPNEYVPLTPFKVPIPVSAEKETSTVPAGDVVASNVNEPPVLAPKVRVDAKAPDELPISPNDAIATASPTTWLFTVCLLTGIPLPSGQIQP
jgi:hypothetical protein